MTTRSTKSLLIGAMASLALALGVTEADAQLAPTQLNTTVPAGTFYTADTPQSIYTAPTIPTDENNPNKIKGGTIRMRSADGKIDGKYGKSAANRMPGLVIWYCNSIIPGGTFFTDLGTGGPGTVTVGNGDTPVDIAGEYKPGTGGGDGKRTYPNDSQINFSGGTPDKPQVIPGEHNTPTEPTGGYNVVIISGDNPKATPACGKGDVTINQLVRGANAAGIDGESKAKLINQGNLTLAKNTHTAYHIENAVPENGACGVTLAGEGVLKIDNFTNKSGFWTLEGESKVELGGTFDYFAGNMNFDCSSIFHYNATTGESQTIAATTNKETDGETSGFYKYGNLWLSGVKKVAQVNKPKLNEQEATVALDDARFRVCTDLRTTTEVELHNKATAQLLNNKKQDNQVFFNLDGVSGPTETTVEIQGRVEYSGVVTNKYLTFNNKDTKVKFEEAEALTFSLNVHQDTKPSKLKDFDPTTDINREVEVDYAGTGKISNLHVSWETTDQKTGFVEPTAATPARFSEAYNIAQERKKLIRVGAQYTNEPYIVKYGKDASADGINLVAAEAPNQPEAGIDFARKLFKKSQIVLSTKTQKVESIVNGRWSDPNTWDTGVEPYATDHVSLKHSIWVGSVGPHFNGARYEENERAITDYVAWAGGDQTKETSRFAAKSITIEDKDNAGLWIVGDDGDLAKTGDKEIMFLTQMDGVTGEVGIINLNVKEQGIVNGSGNGLNGVFINAVTDNYVPVLGSAMFDNRGAFTNNGVLEVGTCK